jgi:hypothetical protein
MDFQSFGAFSGRPAMSQKFHGWTNFETYCVVACLTEDPNLKHYWQQVARKIWENAEETEEQFLGIIPRFENAQIDLADQLRAEVSPVKQWSDFNDCNYLFAQLLTSALAKVDWREVADQFLRKAPGYLSGVRKRIPRFSVDFDSDESVLY